MQKFLAHSSQSFNTTYQYFMSCPAQFRCRNPNRMGKTRNSGPPSNSPFRHIGGNSLQIDLHTIRKDDEAFTQQSWFFLNEEESTPVGQKTFERIEKSRGIEAIRRGGKRFTQNSILASQKTNAFRQSLWRDTSPDRQSLKAVAGLLNLLGKRQCQCLFARKDLVHSSE